jgi:hypothetical protein
MPPKAKKRWYLRWVTFRSFKRAGLVILLMGVASVAFFLLGARSQKLREKERWHNFVARQLRLKAKIAGLLADADQPTDYVMAYHYTCNVLVEYDLVKLEEAEAAQRVEQTVRSCAYFRPDSEPPQTARQLDMASRSSRLFIQAAKHAEAAATYRRAIWQPWTVTQDVGVEKDDP